RFAERVGDDERLVQLYLLSLCDAAMTAPDNLGAWKADLLRELFERARAWFRGAPGAAPDDTADHARARVLQVAGLGAAPIVDGFDPRLFTQLTPRQAARHVALVGQARQAPAPHVALEVHCYPLKGHSELAIVAPDAPGVLAALAGALTANRVDVLGAVLGAVQLADGSRLVADVFYVRDGKGAAIAEADPRWARLAGDLGKLLGGPPAAVGALVAQRRAAGGLPARKTPEVATQIRIHDDSAQATIVEVSTRDRPGVLHAITEALAELGLDISLAKVTTEGEMVADTFYVTRGGARLTGDTERAILIGRLAAALGLSAAAAEDAVGDIR
ncbi:MAG TPA: ACT domain-containing protein, partial [Kofleriaceae bacterium]